MHRIAAVLALVFATGCGKALERERDSFFPTMNEVGDGQFAAFFTVTMGVDAESRDLRPELEMNVGGFTEGSTYEAAFATTFLQPISTFEPSAHTGDLAIAFEPAFGACDGTGYTERADGGCDITVLGTVSSQSSASPRVGFIARVFETDTWTGSEDDIAVTLVVVEAQPE